MNVQYSIRKATVEDITDLIHLRRLMFESMNYKDSDILDKSDQFNEKYFLVAIPNEVFHGWVAEISPGKIVGCGGLVFDSHPPGPINYSGKIGYIMNMSVYPEYRHQGIAKEIFKHILIFLKEQNVVTASLHATDMGRKLYEKFDFTPTNEMRLNLTAIDVKTINSI